MDVAIISRTVTLKPGDVVLVENGSLKLISKAELAAIETARRIKQKVKQYSRNEPGAPLSETDKRRERLFQLINRQKRPISTRNIRQKMGCYKSGQVGDNTLNIDLRLLLSHDLIVKAGRKGRLILYKGNV